MLPRPGLLSPGRAPRPFPMARSAQSDPAALRPNWELRHLLEAIALGDGFQFHILVCDSPRVADSAIALIAKKGSRRMLRIDPYRGDALSRHRSDSGWATDRPVPSLQQLARAVLSPFNELEIGRGPEVVVIDASQATSQEEPAWREVFCILNIRRNVIAKRFAGSLVLCVPPALEVAFAHEAPDFWSIRGATVTVTAPEVRFASPQFGEESPIKQGRGVDSEPYRELEPLRAAIEAASIRNERSPSDPLAMRALAIQLSRSGLQEEERGSLARARRAFEQSLDLRRRLLKREPHRRERQVELSQGLDDLGRVLESSGSWREALGAYEESLGLLRELVSQEPNRGEWLRALAVNLERIGDVESSLGDLRRALLSYEEAIALDRRLVTKDPDQPEWQRDLAVALNKLGDVQARQGAPERALSSYGESLALMRHLLTLYPGRLEWLRDLSATLDRLGDLERRQGRLRQALLLAEESLVLMRRLFSVGPDRPEWLRDLSVSLEKLGDIHRSLGGFTKALRLYEESLALRRRLLAQDPSRPLWRQDLVAVLERLADTSEETGDRARALSFYKECFSVAQKLLDEHLAPQDWPRDFLLRLQRKVEALSQAEPPS